jgi:hypothetical protein
MNMKQSYTGLLARIRGLASRSEGVSYAEALAQGVTTRQLCHNGRHMVRDGELFVVGFRQERRYFSQSGDAARYEAELTRIKASKKDAKRAKRASSRPAVSAKPEKETRAVVSKPTKQEAAPAPVRIATPKVPFKDMQPIVPAHVKVQTIPSPVHFGPAARLAYACAPKTLRPLKVGKEI